MATTYYHAANGHLLGETAAGARSDYLTDGRSSVVATVDQSQIIENTFRYKPFGSQLAKYGVAVDPKFKYFGAKSFTAELEASTYLSSKSHIWNTNIAQMLDYVVSSPLVLLPRNLLALGRPGDSDRCLLKNGWPVPYTTITEPEHLGCGDWGYWGIKWDIPRLREEISNSNEGYIIQWIDGYGRSESFCSPYKDFYDNFYELWFVTSGDDVQYGDPPQSMSMRSTHDVWFQTTGIGQCSDGYAGVEGYAKFYNVPLDCYKEWGYSNNSGAPTNAISGLQPPPGWDSSNSTIRFVRANFVCCNKIRVCLYNAWVTLPNCITDVRPLAWGSR